MERVQKIMSNAGFCSRRRAEELIATGRVKVNGKIIKLGDKATTKDEIRIDGKNLKIQKKHYILLNKPKGYLCSLYDPSNKKKVTELIKIKERVYPIGRLDYMTEGLLLLTNDGDFANRIMHPRYEIKKTYVVKIDRSLEKEDLNLMKSGVKLNDGWLYPNKVRKVKEDLFEITIHEGRKRIIRRLVTKLGYNIFMLKRIQLGLLRLGPLKPGRWRELTKEEIQKFDQPGLRK